MACLPCASGPARACSSLWVVVTLCLLAAPALAVSNKKLLLPRPDREDAELAAVGGGGWRQPSKADMQELGAMASECLAGQHVRLLGNSITRHWLFVLNDLLNGGGKSLMLSTDFENMRQDEKRICTSEAERHLDGQGCTLHPHNGSIHLEYLWEHDIFDNGTELILSERPAPDLLIINAGINDFYSVGGRPSWKANLLEQADLLADALGKLPDSTYIYWRTTTRFCNKTGIHGTYNTEAPYFPMINRCLVDANAHMVDVLTRLAPKVHLFDAFELTQDCRAFLDIIHHPLAAIDHVLIFTSRYCGKSFGSKVLETFPHLAPHFSSSGDIKTRQCRAQRAVATEEDGRDFGDDWNWVNGLLSESKERKYEVDC